MISAIGWVMSLERTKCQTCYKDKPSKILTRNPWDLFCFLKFFCIMTQNNARDLNIFNIRLSVCICVRGVLMITYICFQH